MKSYVLKTERLGLRNWLESDLDAFIQMGNDKEVMEYFPSLLSQEETAVFFFRLQQHFKKYGYCYFAVDILQTGEFIGFTGLANQTWESKYTPCVDIGWRFKRSAWGKGYATEAAKACIDRALTQFNLNEIYAFATVENERSLRVMKKLDMQYLGNFIHPRLAGNERLQNCAVYYKNLLSK